MSGTFESSIQPPKGSGGGGGGITSINGNTTAAQVIAGTSPIKVASSAGTTTLTGPFSSFVFSPGGTATAPGGNIYSDWATMYADLNNTRGTRYVLISDSNITPAVIPFAGMPVTGWNMAGVVLVGALAKNPVAVSIEDGVLLPNLTGISNGLSIQSNSNSPVVIINSGDQYTMYIDKITQFSTIGSGPIVQVDNGSELVVFLQTGGAINTGTAPIFKFINGSSAIFYGEEAASISSNTLADDGSSSVVYFIAANSATMSQSQTGFTGTLGALSLCKAVLDIATVNANGGTGIDVETCINTGAHGYDYVTMTAAGSHVISDDVGGCRLHATGTISSYTVTMPANPTPGQTISLSSDQTVTAITVSPNAGQTINGPSASPFTKTSVGRWQWIAEANTWFVE